MSNEQILDELDKSEWFDVMKRVRPGLSRVEFDELWVKFQGGKNAIPTQPGVK